METANIINLIVIVMTDEQKKKKKITTSNMLVGVWNCTDVMENEWWNSARLRRRVSCCDGIQPAVVCLCTAGEQGDSKVECHGTGYLYRSTTAEKPSVTVNTAACWKHVFEQYYSDLNLKLNESFWPNILISIELLLLALFWIMFLFSVWIFMIVLTLSRWYLPFLISSS